MFLTGMSSTIVWDSPTDAFASMVKFAYSLPTGTKKKNKHHSQTQDELHVYLARNKEGVPRNSNIINASRGASQAPKS